MYYVFTYYTYISITRIFSIQLSPKYMFLAYSLGQRLYLKPEKYEIWMVSLLLSKVFGKGDFNSLIDNEDQTKLYDMFN